MRIAALEVRNFRGVAYAALDALGDKSVLIISGKNGTGKSLLLEAIATIWELPHFVPSDRVGPWATQAELSMTVELDEREAEAIARWRKENGYSTTELTTDRQHSITAKLGRFGQVPIDGDIDPVFETLRDLSFQADHPFARVSFLPSARHLPLLQDPQIRLDLISSEIGRQEHQNRIRNYLERREAIDLTAVPSYLMTIDYQRLLAARQELQVNDDYGEIAEILEASSGKTIQSPKYDDADGKVSIDVALPTGETHPLAMLSSGEQSLIAMSYFIRRVKNSRGVLLIDEPELHLHPSLQAALIENVKGMGEPGQILIVSHSGPLISAAPPGSVARMSRPNGGIKNQLAFLQVPAEKRDVLADLGLSRAAIAQTDCFLFVEGPTDRRFLSRMFPVEVARCTVIDVGGADAVESRCRLLEDFDAEFGIPFLGIRDNDFLGKDEREELERSIPGLYVLPGREIESLFLDAKLIAKTLSYPGGTATEEQVAVLLDEFADEIKDRVLVEQTKAELARMYPPDKPPGRDKWDELKLYFETRAETNALRAASIGEAKKTCEELLESEWGHRKLELADPKILLENVHLRWPLYKSAGVLMDALAGEIGTEPESASQEVANLRRKIREKLGIQTNDQTEDSNRVPPKPEETGQF